MAQTNPSTVWFIHLRAAKSRVREDVSLCRIRCNDCCWQILLQKSFWGGERKFSEPLMPFARGDVRDHIVSFRIDHGPP